MKKMTLLLMVLFMVSCVTSVAFAQTPLQVCNEKSSLAWQMNSEADMDKYTVYHSDAQNIAIGSVGVQSFDVPHDPASATPDPTDPTLLTVVEKFPATFAEGNTYFAISASDKSGNESALSNEIGCNVDKSPSAPTLILNFG